MQENKIGHYVFVSGENEAEVQNEINSLLKRGYEPHGTPFPKPLFTAIDDLMKFNSSIVQAMVFRGKISQNIKGVTECGGVGDIF